MSRKKIILEPSFKLKREEEVEKLLKRRDMKDFSMVGKMTGLSYLNIHHALKRIGSIHHEKIFNALTIVIENREQMVKDNMSAMQKDALVKEEY